jgi:threonine/homoserine/homoserine lactone efflux protein
VEASIVLYLLSVAGVTFIGTIAPGPVVAATVAKGEANKHAGLLMSLGIVLVNLPVVILLRFGLGSFLFSARLQDIASVGGGIVLLFMGIMLLRSSGEQVKGRKGLPGSSILTGVLVWVVNPYFYIFWATVGVSLLMQGVEFGFAGLVLFVVVQWGFAALPLELISQGVFRTKRFWGEHTRKIVFAVCAFALAGFGIWFIASVFL